MFHSWLENVLVSCEYKRRVCVNELFVRLGAGVLTHKEGRVCLQYQYTVVFLHTCI